MNKKTIQCSLLLLLAATIWGVAFVAQSAGMDYVGPLTFNASRFIIGGIVLLPFVIVQERKEVSDGKHIKVTLIGGLCCGLAICIASLFQQYGIMYTTVGKAGFLTALYIVIVPILGIFLHKKPRNIVWIGAFISLIGLYLLCMKDQLSFNKGDLLVLCCAFVFAIHILVIDYFSPKANGVTLSCIQFLFSGIVCLIGALILEHPTFDAIMDGIIPILYAGVMSCGVAYTLQILGQKHVEPTTSSMILSLESVVSVLAGWMILQQRLSIREIMGCIIMFSAVILVQLPERKMKNV